MLTLSAAETVGKNLKKGATVVLESTVYPGVTEEVVAPINFRTRLKDELRYGFLHWLFPGTGAPSVMGNGLRITNH
jgi:hypothetical protein